MLVPDLWRELVKLFVLFSANITIYSHITLGKKGKQQTITALVLTVFFMSVSDDTIKYFICAIQYLVNTTVSDLQMKHISLMVE